MEGYFGPIEEEEPELIRDTVSEVNFSTASKEKPPEMTQKWKKDDET